MDGQRVGVADYVTIPSAISGMFAHPDCYSVGVSFNAMVGDGRFWSRALYKGEGFPSFADLAHQLQGKFLMIHGMLDASMPAAAVFQVAQALQDANKSFDMLLLPNDEHGGSEYANKRMWDYLVEHLLGETPPADFRLNYFAPEFNE